MNRTPIYAAILGALLSAAPLVQAADTQDLPAQGSVAAPATPPAAGPQTVQAPAEQSSAPHENRCGGAARRPTMPGTPEPPQGGGPMMGPPMAGPGMGGGPLGMGRQCLGHRMGPDGPGMHERHERDLAVRLDLLDARMIRIETMLERLLQRQTGDGD